MRLKRVRIFGFKTFADRTEFSLEGGVVAVVGPNGCGKSNLVDAILWGLGEGNARQLRAQNGQDVIFNGSANRKPVGFAEVTLLFDNEDGALPIDTAEVTVARKLNRNGDSEYSINRRQCRLRDIYDLLADSGLGRAGYAIVGQKEIDAALSASAEDRRAWIDEAAGVQRYRARKVESLRRLNQAQEHLSRVADILRELETQRGPLEEEAEVALRFRSVQTALREIEVGLLAREATSARQELEELERKILDSQKLSQTEAIRAQELDLQVRAIGSEISEIELEMDSVRGLQQGCLTALERSEADLRLAKQKLQSLDDLEKNLEQDGAEGAVRIGEAEKELAAVSEEAAKEQAALDELRTSMAGVGEEARLLTDTLRLAERELNAAREAHARWVKAQAEASARDDRRALAERERKGVVDSIPDLEQGIAEANAAYEEAVAEWNKQQEKSKEIDSRLLAIRQEEERDAQSVRNALSEKASLEGRRRGIEATIDAHEGLTQGAKAVMEASERGILQAEYVPVGQAIETDKDVALAIETALGGSSNDLIAEDERDAKDAINWLKQHRAGRATFQPIPLMRPFEPSYELKRLLNENGIVGRASELVSTKPKYRPVIDSLLGRVVIVEDIDVALKFAKTTGWSRMVTLDGEVVHSSGAVTGGQQSRTGYGMVQRKADLGELDEKIEKLGLVVRDFEGRSAKRKRQTEQEQEAAKLLRSLTQEKASEMQEARNFVQTLQNELKSAQRELEKLDRELQQLNTETSDQPPVDLPAAEQKRDEALKALAAKSADAEQAEGRLRDAQQRLQQSQVRVVNAKRRLDAAQSSEQARKYRVENLEPERIGANAEIVRAGEAIEVARTGRTEADARLEKLQVERRTKLEESLRLSEEAKHARDNAAGVAEAGHQAEVTRARAESRRAAALQRLLEEYNLSEEEAHAATHEQELPEDALTVVNRLRRELRAMGDVNLGAIEAFERLSARLDELTAQQDDILGGVAQVEASIKELDKLTRERFVTTFEQVQKHFSEMFLKLFGGGSGQIQLTDPQNTLESGIEIDVSLPGKKRQPLNLLSGGERSLCTVAFLFSLLKVKPSPLVVLDEVDAPLDGRNVERFAGALQEFTDHTQFIVITHNPTTIATAPVWLGVSMQEPGVSTLVPVRLPEEKKIVEETSAISQ